jgi:hypothetical protein
MYAALGITGSKALLVQGIYGAVGPITNLFFIIFILDKVGRKKPLMFGAASFIVTFSILAAIVASYPVPPAPADGSALIVPSNVEAAQRAGIAMIFLTSIFFSLSFGPVSWVLASEVSESISFIFFCAEDLPGFPNKCSLYRNGSCYLFQLGFQCHDISGKQGFYSASPGLTLQQVSPIGMKNIGWRFYIIFIALNTADLILVSWQDAETYPMTEKKL